MPWCPLCRNEYIEGKTRCPDCDTELVSELAETPKKNLPPIFQRKKNLPSLRRAKLPPPI